jgi:hypothetical protein
MSTASERAEVLAELKLVTFRRLGANRVHVALVMPASLVPGSHFGAACTFVAAPVKALCDRTLRGALVEIPDEHLEGWKRQGHLCRECVLTARAGLALAERREP